MAKTILAVDDSHTIRKAIELTFQSTDFEVVTAEDEHAALDQLASSPAAVVLIDAGLSDDAGYRLAQTIKSRDPSTPVVFLTSGTHAWDAARGQQAGVGAHIDKPFETQALIDLVTREAEEPATGPAGRAPEAVGPAGGRPTEATERVAFHAPPAPRFAPGPEPDLEIDFDGATRDAYSADVEDVEEIEEIDIEDVPDEPSAFELELESPISTPPRDPPRPAAPSPSSRSLEPAPRATPVPRPSASPSPEAPRPASSTSSATAGAVDLMARRAQDAEPILQNLPADELRRIARDVLERVAWEVVPDLAEVIIREELDRLTRDR